MGRTNYIGKTLDGRYKIGQLLDQGGMGAVYLGYHINLERKVAVKFLHSELAVNKNIVKRFFREARAAVSIKHNNIIDVLDLGVSSENEPYFVMEYLEGESLSTLLKRTGPLGLQAAFGILEPVLVGLGAAHAKGIVHRDLKPGNVFLERQSGEVPTIKLIDFGISKLTHNMEQSQLTQTGSTLGTMLYMAPEQARGAGDVDHRADIYSAGVVLYRMLTGGFPFVGSNTSEILVSLLTEEPTPPKDVYPQFPMEVESLVMGALSKDPAMRPKSTTEMLRTIRNLSSHDERQKHLTALSAGIETMSCAGGYLGTDNADGGTEFNIADLLSGKTDGEISSAWVGTRKHSVKKTRRLVWAGLGLAAIVAAILVGMMIGPSGIDPVEREPTQKTATPETPTLSVEKTDKIAPKIPVKEPKETPSPVGESLSVVQSPAPKPIVEPKPKTVPKKEVEPTKKPKPPRQTAADEDKKRTTASKKKPSKKTTRKKRKSSSPTLEKESAKQADRGPFGTRVEK